ncbi:hypothetical protein [Streptomyces swartbergensis]|uniref:hypothetical protein n=1 Tax=Streptomyces swartbergensis TaxID=487165 RepID=UPI003824250E
MASEDEGLVFAEEIDPALAKILADIRDYCEAAPPEEALDLTISAGWWWLSTVISGSWRAAWLISEGRDYDLRKIQTSAMRSFMG